MALKKTFEIQIDGVTTAVTNVKALREAQEATEKAFREADFGTAEYARLGKQLQGLETELEKVKISTDALSGADRVEGFVRFGSAITGVVGSASLLGTALGNSSEELEQAEAKLGAFLATMQTFKAIQEAVGKENKFLTSLMARFGATSNVASEAIGKQTIAQRVLNLVMKANPIGLIITAIGVLIGLFALVANNIDTLRAKFAPAFGFIEGLIDSVVGKVRDLASLLSGGFFNDAATAKDIAAAQAVVDGIDEVTAAYDRQLKLAKANGATQQEQFLLQEAKLVAQLNALIKLKKAGQDLSKEQLEEAKNLENDLKVLRIENAKRTAEAVAASQQELQDALRKADEEAAKRAEEAAKKRFADSVAENEKIKIEKIKSTELRDKELEKLEEDRLKRLADFTQANPLTVPVQVEIEEQVITDGIGRAASLALDKYQEIMETKGGEVFQEVGGRVSSFLGDAFAAQIDRASEQLDFINEAVRQTESELQESASRTNELEDQLTNSRGQRREFLIAQIEKEREREKVLENQKKAQAKEEAKRQKELDQARRRAALLNKVINIGQAFQENSLAILRALSSGLPPPAPIILAGVVGALGAAQIATIAAQKFALGGRVRRGYELDGFPAYGDNTLALVRPGEVILNESQQVRIGGPAALRKAGVPGFAGGGLASMNLTPPPPMNLDFAGINGSAFNQADLASEIRKLGKDFRETTIVVQPQQVVNEAAKMTEIQNRGTI